MADVSYLMGQVAATALGWQKMPDRKWYGVDTSQWSPKAGSYKVGTGEFGPVIDALPSKLTLSYGNSRMTLYVRGTKQHPIVDGVGLIGPQEWAGVLAAWKKEYPLVVAEIERQQAWDTANPMYKERKSSKVRPAKSKLNPSQLEVG